MLRRLLPLLALLTACSGHRSGAPDTSGAGQAPMPRPPESARAIPIVALRLLAGGGALRAYTLPALAPATWALGGRTSPVAAVIGMDEAGRRLVYRDSAGRVDAFDLVAYRERPVEADSVYVGRGAITALAPDGTLYSVLPDGMVIESAPYGATAWPNRVGRGVRDAFSGVEGTVLAIRHGSPDTLLFASREAGISLRVSVPSAPARVASRDGDAVAVVTDSGLVVVEEREPQTPWFVRLKGSPVTAAFTPSGHRIYVALRTRSELAVVDRFARNTLASVALPGPADALRMDPWGRAVFVHPAAGDDETWVVSIADDRVSGHLATRWASDLPTVSEDGVVLAREGPNVVARDIRSLDSLGAVVAGAADFWFVGRWKPTTSPNVLREEAPLPAPRRARAAAGAAAAAPKGAAPAAAESTRATAPQRVWVQVSVSQNEKASRDLAAELGRAGHAAQVIAPRSPGEGWRVVVGPYPSRASADSAGRLLGRPYYILEPGPESPVRP